MQLLENGKLLCPVLGIQDTNRTEFVITFGSLVPLSSNSVFYMLTLDEPTPGLGANHSIAFPAEKKLLKIQINKTIPYNGSFLSEIVYLGQSNL